MSAPSRTKRKVLVIDDSDTARHALRDLLQSADYDVVLLPSAIGATRLILQQQIEAVVVDLSMPGLSGDRLIEVLRKNPRLQNLVVILVSGESDEDLQRVRLRIDVNAVMSKVAVNSQLVPLLDRLFPKQRSPAKAASEA